MLDQVKTRQEIGEVQHGGNCRQITTGKLKLSTGNIKEHSDLYNTGAGTAVQRSGMRKGQGSHWDKK